MHRFTPSSPVDSGLVADDIGLGNFKQLKRKVGTVVAGVSPLGLFVQPKVMGIKSAKGQKLYTKVQRVQRIVGTTALAIATGGVAAGAMEFGAPGIGSLGALKALGLAGVTKVKDFLVAKGVNSADALGLAKEVLAGQRPVPSELDAAIQAEIQAQQRGGAGTGVGAGIGPLLVVGALGVGAMAFMRQD